MGEEHRSGDAWFIRFLSAFFGACGDLVVNHAWKLMIASTLLTALCTLKIPLTPLTNDISDFTPQDAPSFAEWRTSQQFFEGGVQSNTVYALITAKDRGSMYTVPKMSEAIRALDTVFTKFNLQTPRGELPFGEFCRAFCVGNEPLRAFYEGMRMRETLGENATDIDLTYPESHAMGVKIHVDPYLFAVKIAAKRDGHTAIIPTYEANDLNTEKPLRNNIKEYKLVVLIFKSELDPSISKAAIEKWEASVVNYFYREFNSSLVHVTIFAESFITSEIIRAGLSLLPFLVIGFIIMFTFSVSSYCISGYALNQLGFSKVWLAFYACATPFMSCGVGLGGIFGTILCVTPFLILAIGVDDAYLMVNGWVQITAARRREDLRSTTVEKELLYRTKEMLIETGPSVAITTITNVAAFAISALSGSPEIQLFSIGNAVCVFIAFIFQLTIYASLMVILGRREIQEEFRARESPTALTQATAEKNLTPLEITAGVDIVRFENRKTGLTALAHKILRTYCAMLSNKLVVAGIMALLALYLAVSIDATLKISRSLKPEKLLLSDSPLTGLYHARQEYVLASYSVLWIFVFNPGNIWDPKRRALIDAMIHDFESLSHSVGPYSTKLFLRDFEEYIKENPNQLMSDDVDENGSPIPTTKYQQLQEFLGWPEHSYWRGLVQFEPEESMVNGSEPAITRFFLTTAYKGADLKDWSIRVILLKELREIAKRYSALNITVHQEDGKFLDVIDTIVPQTVQSAMLTLASMFAVTMLFIPAPLVLCTATFTIISTSLGAFGFMSWVGTDLDPILMCATIMVIGFSVDIPAHIAYHYAQTAGHFTATVDRLEHTIARVGFPIAQASISTIICVGSLFFANIPMSNTFATAMSSVVLIGTIHGLFIMPAIFSAASMLGNWARSGCCSRSPVASIVVSHDSSVNGEVKLSRFASADSSGSTTIVVQQGRG